MVLENSGTRSRGRLILDFLSFEAEVGGMKIDTRREWRVGRHDQFYYHGGEMNYVSDVNDFSDKGRSYTGSEDGDAEVVDGRGVGQHSGRFS
jgi:hypothetical protein